MFSIWGSSMCDNRVQVSASALSCCRVLSWWDWAGSLVPLLCCLSAPCWWGRGRGVLLWVLLGKLGKEEVHTLDQNRIQEFLLLCGESAQNMTVHRRFPCRPANPDPKSRHHLQEKKDPGVKQCTCFLFLCFSCKHLYLHLIAIWYYFIFGWVYVHVFKLYLTTVKHKSLDLRLNF